MSNTNNHHNTTCSPSHYAYHVRDRENAKSIWTRIGSAWAHADGKGLNVLVECLPTDGRISLRVVEEARSDEPTATH